MWFLICLNPVSFLKNFGVSNICQLKVHCVHFVIDTSTKKYSIIFSLLDAGADGKVGICFNTYHSHNLQNKDGVQKQWDKIYFCWYFAQFDAWLCIKSDTNGNNWAVTVKNDYEHNNIWRVQFWIEKKTLSYDLQGSLAEWSW